jgi:inosose dehydratase
VSEHLTNGSADYPLLRLGTAPDSWGVWFASDPHQVAWSTYLDEVAQAGYRWTELGPYGYLPTDPGRLATELARRELTLTGGTVFAALHRGQEALQQAKRDCDVEAATLLPLGARYLVLLPEGYTDLDGNLTQSPELSAEQWHHLTSGMSELGRYVEEEHGLELVFHSHADSHVGTQEEIVRLLENTDPAHVNLCLDTGHVAYCGADNLAIIERYPERIGYVHLKQVDRAIRQRVRDERLGFAPAVRLGAMVEPPLGEPDMPSLLAALGALDRELFCIVEQDMYPCAPDVPLPIATRTRQYFARCGLDAGRPRQG